MLFIVLVCGLSTPISDLTFHSVRLSWFVYAPCATYVASRCPRGLRFVLHLQALMVPGVLLPIIGINRNRCLQDSIRKSLAVSCCCSLTSCVPIILCPSNCLLNILKQSTEFYNQTIPFCRVPMTSANHPHVLSWKPPFDLLPMLRDGSAP